MELDSKKEIRIKGLPVCAGIAIGTPFLYRCSEDEMQSYSIDESQVKEEVQRFYQALDKSCEQILSLQKQLEDEGAYEGVMILEAHLQIIKDELIVSEIEKGILEKRKNVESLFKSFIHDYERQFEKLSGEVFKEKVCDIQDVSKRILHNLKNTAKSPLPSLEKDSIVFTQDLSPSDAAEVSKSSVNAFVSNTGGRISHAAIIARSKGIPYVANISLDHLQFESEDLVIVDGRSGEVIINPTASTLNIYRSFKEQLDRYLHSLDSNEGFFAETLDGCRVKLTANVEAIEEIELIHRYKGDGVGLFRSEYLCLAKNRFPTEEEQFEVYKKVALAGRGLPVVIRTFDVGGDKSASFLKLKEDNPFLGCRAIRYMLQNPLVFRTQLRAILRASAFGEIKIIFPMVSNVLELLQAKEHLQQEMQSLKKDGINFDPHIKVGCMIEIPSAALTCDEFAKHCDFLSIGTNDLVQYSLAVDRGNQMMSYLYNPTDPSVLRLIKMVVVEAGHCGIPVSVCGEIATDPRFTALLLGLGINELSCAARFIPLIKNAIRKTSIISASKLAGEIMCMRTSEDIQKKLNYEYEKLAPQDPWSCHIF